MEAQKRKEHCVSHFFTPCFERETQCLFIIAFETRILLMFLSRLQALLFASPNSLNPTTIICVLKGGLNKEIMQRIKQTVALNRTKRFSEKKKLKPKQPPLARETGSAGHSER